LCDSWGPPVAHFGPRQLAPTGSSPYRECMRCRILSCRFGMQLQAVTSPKPCCKGHLGKVVLAPPPPTHIQAAPLRRRLSLASDCVPLVAARFDRMAILCSSTLVIGHPALGWDRSRAMQQKIILPYGFCALLRDLLGEEAPICQLWHLSGSPPASLGQRRITKTDSRDDLHGA
jgi:hypothetical protein